MCPMRKENGLEISKKSFQVGELVTDCEQTIKVLLSERGSQITYSNEYCQFKPLGYAQIGEVWYPLTYKVVTPDMKSLGFRHNPTVLEFPIGEWVYEQLPLSHGKKDFGGIWSAIGIGGTHSINDHLDNTRNYSGRTFLTAIDNPVYANSYRIKSEGVMLLKEIDPIE